MKHIHKCVCGKDGKKTCSKCGIKRYCSKKCQVKDWKTNHKKVCSSESRLPEKDKTYYMLKGKNNYKLKTYTHKNTSNIQKNSYQMLGYSLGLQIRGLLMGKILTQGENYIYSIKKYSRACGHDNVYDHYLLERDNNMSISFMLYTNIMYPDNVFMIFSLMKKGISYEINSFLEGKCECSDMTSICGPKIDKVVISNYKVDPKKVIYRVLDNKTFKVKGTKTF